MARVIELPELGVERSFAQQTVDALRGKTIINEATGIRARLSSSARGKLVSNKATGKSKANGFSQQQHNALVANIAEIYQAAALRVSRPDRDGDVNILSIKRFVTKVKFGRRLAAAWITVKESKMHGHHIYSVEAIKLEALDRIVEVVSGNTPHASSAPTRGMIAFFPRCVNAVLGKIFTHRSLLAATLAAALLLLAPLAARAGSISFRGQTIEYGGAELQWVGEVGSGAEELLLIYTNDAPDAVNFFLPHGQMETRILAVAGGGAGGCVRNSGYTSHSGGGGGGGGEVVDRTGIKFDGGVSNAVFVGRGGLPQGTISKQAAGENGHDSFIVNYATLEGTDLLRVKGGGGGGGESVGNPGGSGGGGSYASSSIKAGGASEKNEPDGHGNGGGTAVTRFAGGGGGAGDGGIGENGQSNRGGNGGDGLESDINPEKPDAVYGGGGGGGNTNSGNAGAGGKGGGGHGGKTATSSSSANGPEVGTPNTGGGGGGAGRYSVGAKGGSGIIIIRVYYAVVPIQWTEIPVTVGGKTGYVRIDDKASYKWDNGDLVITYNNVNFRGALRVGDEDMPVWANARVLAVGGGGGGGFIDQMSAGAGAGGGAGGYVERSGLVFDNTTQFSIIVGRGGGGSSTYEETGEDGSPSSLRTNDVDVVEEALGGGGGGAHSNGRNGGSGGGGSEATTLDETEDYDRKGGVGKSGQGFDGGFTKYGMFVGAGGGGAGGKGGNGESITGGYAPGAGGLGMECDITGEKLWYAGGGGGARINNPDYERDDRFLGGKGGSGVGGDGAGADDTTQLLVPIPATSGMDGRGGGGGGGTSHTGATTPAGNGGSGVVIIRLSRFVVQSVPIPSTKNYTYDGTEKVGVEEFFAYELSGTPIATNADVYSVTATMKPGSPYYWADWHEGDPEEKKWGPRTVSWQINQLKVPVPAAVNSVVYNGFEQYAVDRAKYHVDINGYCYTDSGLKYCLLTPTYHATDAAVYNFKAKLVADYESTPNVTNFTWASSPYTMDDRDYQWAITQAPNKIEGFTYNCYLLSRIDGPNMPHHPSKHFSCVWGFDTAKYEYRPIGEGEGEGEGEGWREWPPTEKGSYTLRITIPETPNWQGDVVTKDFGTWERLDDIFTDRMTVTVSGNTSGTTVLDDFPVPVRVKEPDRDGFSAYSGFQYVRAGATGKELRFFDSAGDPVEHEVDTWNINGESVLWVRVPKLSSTGTQLTMCWRRTGDILLPEYDPTAVWNKVYSGVWHLAKPEDGVYADSSGNERHAHLTAGAKVRSVDGPMAKGLYIENGDLIVDGWPFKPGTITNAFTYSGWYRYPDYVADGKVTGGYKMFAGVKMGASTTTEMQNNPGWAIRPNNNLYQMNWQTTGQNWNWNWGSTAWNIQTTWGYLGYRTGYLTPTASKGAGVARYYAFNATFNESGTDGITYYVNGSDQMLQLATGGFEVDEVRFTTNVLTKTWMEQEYRTLYVKDYCTYSLVRIDCDRYNNGNGLQCDWWTTVPSIAKTAWRAGEAFPTEVSGAWKSGAGVSKTYRLLPDGDPSATHPTAVGYYRATYDHGSTVTSQYRPQPYTIDFYIIEATVPVYDIGGNGGDSGRVLLMNADNKEVKVKVEGEERTYSCPVTNQGWCAQGDEGVTYWRTLSASPGTNNVMPGASFELVRSADTNVLWRLYDCRQGNTFPTNEAAGLLSSLCYLPKSEATALSITNENVAATLRGDAGWVLMRNVACPELVVDEFAPPTGACVYSPCYSNGIGTIYFDAVNGRKAVVSGVSKNDESYRIVLEVATETTDGLPPWDENSYTTDDTHTNWYGRLEGKWRPVELSVMKAENGSYSDQPVTNCFALKISTGGYQNRFYRIHARVDIHQPVRFRIRRVSVDETARGADGLPEPDDGYLLLDNIIASFPPVVAELKPYGHFDPTLGDVRAVGYGGAFETPFPSVADAASLTGRCSVAFTGELESEAEAFSLAQMFYRSRYLNQLRDPSRESGAEWKVAELTRVGDEMRTAGPLAVTNQPGDVEFYFVTILKTPYYGYVDYSGTGVPVWPPIKGGYTEEGLPHENSYKSPYGDPLASGGTDWFVRLREGRSRYEGLRLLTRPSGGGAVTTNAFELVGDDQWTVKLRTRNPVAKGLDVRIEGLNPQTPGAREYAFSTDFWRPDAAIARFPSREGVSACAADEWGWVACDAATGWLYFQLDLNARALQVAHAEAEDFSRWSSALNANGLFVGSAVDTNASSAVTTESEIKWERWPATSASEDSWHEDFSVPNSIVTTSIYPRNAPFSTARSRLGWTAESAMWTFGQWSRQNNADASKSMGDDSAVQLEGRGKGRLSFIDASKVPDGLDTVAYRARIGQVNAFNDFTYYDWYFGESIDDMEPTKLMSDYTVATIAALTETGATSYDGDGSVSLIGYYNRDYGCYEFRVSRGVNDKDLRLALFRWRKSGAGYVCEPLYDATDVTKRKNYFDFNSDNKNPERGSERLVKNSRTLYGGLFLSVREQDGKTLITGGVCEKDVSTMTGTESMSGQKFTCVTYYDNSSDPLTKGTFGLCSCNCPAVFAQPICYRAGVQTVYPSADNLLQSKTAQTVSFTGDKVSGENTDKYFTKWEKPGRLVRATGHEWWGFQAAAPEPQTMRVQISPHGASQWEDVYVNTVRGFTDEEFRNVIHDPRKCDVRLQVGDAPSSARTDVIVNDVSVTQWNGQWTPNWDTAGAPWYYLTNDFVYTSGWVADRSGRRSLLLQPSRAQSATTPVSVRSPLMRGLGLVHFKWRNADPRARLRVQYKENVSLYSIKSATETQASDEKETTDGWVDLTAIDVGAIGESGSRSVYVNRRYDKTGSDRNYLYGLVRIIVDKDVQAEAIAGDRRRTDPYYGAVEITEAFVWDLPEYDKSGWSGWNFRAAGWDGSDPDTFANLKDGFRGLSGLLNNTLDPDTLADREKGHYSAMMPGVQSPMFGTNCVGALSFRARLYDDGDLDKAGYPAVVSVYGCNSFDDKGEPRDWGDPNKPIAEVMVSNRTYSTFSVKIPATLDCKAIRLAVRGVKGVTATGTPKYDPPLRVAIDDICIWERLSQSVAFRKSFVRPFRDAKAIKGTAVVPDIDQMAEQPLASESFGFQAEVEVLDPDEVLTGDPEHPVTVDLWYYAGSDVWGFENWRTNPAAVKVTGLRPATDAGDRLVFRSTVEQSASLCPPQFLEEGEGYRIVQYHVVAKYYVQGGSEGVHDLQSSEWEMPEWNRGFADPNATNAAFSAFTLLESIAPGRVWINEINYCEPNKNDSIANQYIELAVPSGVDMTDWTVTAYGWDGSEIGKLATLGRKLLPASKTYRGSNPIALASHYAFYTLKGPKTTTLPVDGKWDGTWTVSNALEYNRPYAFELRRPTGVVEHRVVAQGWNQARDDGYWYAFRYDGTNTVEVMHQKDGGTWTWSQEDYHDAASANCSVSVVTNQGALHADWVSPLQKTPGEINIGQYIDPNWWIEPNGGYVKIYSNVIGAHMRQIIGNVTNLVGDMTISQGLSTSIVYEVDRWYQLGDRSVTPDERATWSGPQAGVDGKRYYTLSLSQVSNRMDIVVAATNSDEVTALIDPKYASYTPAIMRWLETGVTGWNDGGHHPFKNPNGPLQVGYYRGHQLDNPLPDGEDNKLDLVHLYWFDLDPTAGGWELWGGMGARPGSAVSLPVDERQDRTKVLASGETVVHTNHLTSFWMELRNAGLNEPTGLSYPPYRLQGLKNEQSDMWADSWTSATFKVTMCLNNGKVDWLFRPMRYFVFGPGSFYPANHAETPYAAVVEITDPFSNQSPASEWGWKKYESESMRENGLFTRWRIDSQITPAGVSTLKKDDKLSF